MRVKIEDIRKAKFCLKGARLFCKKHNLDWSNFLKEGIEKEKLRVLNDAMANKVIEVACGRIK